MNEQYRQEQKQYILTEMARLADLAGQLGERDLMNFLQMGILGARLPQGKKRWLVGKGMLLLNVALQEGRRN